MKSFDGDDGATPDNASRARGLIYTKQQSKAHVGGTGTPFHKKVNKASKSSGRRSEAISKSIRAKDEDEDDQYVSFENVRRKAFARMRQHTKKEEQLVQPTCNSRRCQPSSYSPATGTGLVTSEPRSDPPSPSFPPRDEIPVDIIINTSLSDESSLITLDDSLTSLEGLNVAFPSQSAERLNDRFRSVQFKRVVMVHTYDTSERPICSNNTGACTVDGLFKKPADVRKLGLYERIALYEKRPDLAPFYNNQWATSINGMVLAPIDATLETTQKVKQMGAQAVSIVTGGGKKVDLSGGIDAIAGANSPLMTIPGNFCHQEAREYIESSSLLEDKDSRDEMVEGISIRDESEEQGSVKSGRENFKVSTLCHLYEPAAFNRILGCMKGE